MSPDSIHVHIGVIPPWISGTDWTAESSQYETAIERIDLPVARGIALSDLAGEALDFRNQLVEVGLLDPIEFA